MRRKTEEVDIEVRIGDEMNEMVVKTGDKVLDHMLKTLSFYMEIPLIIEVRSWDLRHHLWEDMGMVLGEELERNVLGDRKVMRFGSCTIPMDDALVMVVVDLSSRPFLNFDVDFVSVEEGFEPSLVREFLMGLVRTLKMTLHVKKFHGYDSHHIIEAIFKALGKALSDAFKDSDRIESTKGDL